MSEHLKSLDAAGVAFLSIIAIFAWHFGKEVCTALARKYWNKIDGDYLTKDEFRLACHENRINCIVVKGFEQSLKTITENQQAMRTALRIIIIHTVQDKELQSQALQELD